MCHACKNEEKCLSKYAHLFCLVIGFAKIRKKREHEEKAFGF